MNRPASPRRRPNGSWPKARPAASSRRSCSIANPNSAAADLTFTYVTETGQTVTRTHSVPANGRLTINIEAEGSATILNNAAVATRVLSTHPGGRRARPGTWPNAPSQWYEAHNAFGVTAAGTAWGLAEGQTGRFEAANSYILLANNTSGAATVTIDFIREVDVAGDADVHRAGQLALQRRHRARRDRARAERRALRRGRHQHGADRRRAGDVLERERRVLERGHRRRYGSRRFAAARLPRASSRRAQRRE